MNQNFQRFDIHQSNSLKCHERFLIFEMFEMFFYRFSQKFNFSFVKNQYEITKLNEFDKQRKIFEFDNDHVDIK